jgi:hypothetical protein
MGVITLKISDEVERKLRMRAAESRGAGRGALSKSVEDAIMVWLEQSPPPSADRRFVAIRDGKRIAEGDTLVALAKSLAGLGVNPRDVEIQQVPSPEDARRLGLRTSSMAR